jgi:hypothetical protein
MFLLTLKPIACWAWEIQYFLYKTEPRIISLHILISAGQGGGSKQEQHFFLTFDPSVSLPYLKGHGFHSFLL